MGSAGVVAYNAGRNLSLCKDFQRVASLTIENYVKAIYRLCTEHHFSAAPTGKLAESLGVFPGSVTSMLKTLSEAGLAIYAPYEGARLTDSGRLLALRVVRRHRLIELFLVKTLDLSWDEVHAEAEVLEHAMSDLLIDRMDQFLGFPSVDPHGDPIPKADGTVAHAAGLTLADLAPPVGFRVLRVSDQTPDFLRFLGTVGLRIGASGTLREFRPEADVLEVEVEGKIVPLAQHLARQIIVGVESVNA